MTACTRLAALCVLACVAACQTAKHKPAAPERAGGTLNWPVSQGWRKETIPFPLDFAKDLPFSGVEEIRFAPGMFKPSEEGYWSYAFVWWLDGRPQLGPAELQSALTRYFAGLTTEVAKEKGFPIDPSRFSVSLHSSSRPQQKAGHAVRAFAGAADLYDAFATGKPITLNLDVWVWDCEDAGKRVAIVLASPQPTTEPIWKALVQRRDELVCH